MTDFSASNALDKASVERLYAFIRAHPRLTVITGAGCSTDSGIPDYRDPDGSWKRGHTPVQGPEFRISEQARRRYWSRSLLGWPYFSKAQPNASHHALTRLQSLGYLQTLITQNVDGLHERAGTQEVITLHGTLSRVICLDCGHSIHRDQIQAFLERHNPQYCGTGGELRPDGDMTLAQTTLDDFRVPNCTRCGGLLKPDVVFFGDSVTQQTVSLCEHAIRNTDALLCVGSSLMVYSSFRFARLAAREGRPIAAINLGRTRADELLTLKINAACSPILQALADALPPAPTYTVASTHLQGN